MSLKKIYDNVTEDIFDMFLIKKLKKKNGGCSHVVRSSASS